MAAVVKSDIDNSASMVTMEIMNKVNLIGISNIDCKIN